MEPLNLIWPLAGGLLIGLSAAVYLLFNGRIAGISGLTANLVGLSPGPRAISAGFLIALVIGAWIGSMWLRAPTITVSSSLPLLIGGGLLVGFGTRLGGGCTSGHGVCGIARLAPRSITATLIFMAVAIATVFVIRSLLGQGAA